MEQAIDEFIMHLATEHGASANTLGAYATDLRQLQDCMRRRQVLAWADLQPDDLEHFVGELQLRRYATTSIARKVAAVKSFLAFLRRSGVTQLQPSVVLAAPAVHKVLPRPLGADEVARLFAQLTGDSSAALRDAAMLHTLYATGMRVSELIAVTVRNVDVDLAHIFCPGRDGRERILPLSDVARAALDVYVTRARPQLARGADTPTLFLNHHGARLTRQGFWLIVKGYARAADLGAITPHTLRHAFALDMLAQGMELRSVQQLLGHANLSTTQVYRQMRPAAEAEQFPPTARAAEDDTAAVALALARDAAAEAVACGAHE